MKKLPFLALFALLTLTSSYFSTVISATTTKTVALTSCFDHFRIHRQGNSVAMSWAAAAPDVVHFAVERSYDGEFYETLNEMSCNGTTVHKFKDDSIYPGVIYYRIKAVKADGSTEFSSIESVRIVQRK
jgi:hypothetical protein